MDVSKKKNPRKIVVTGDCAVDWFEISTPPPESYSPDGEYEFNWETYPGIARFARPGGALLLADFIRNGMDVPVLSPGLTNIARISPNTVIQDHTELAGFAYSTGDGKKVVRVSKYKGFTGTDRTVPLAISKDNVKADLVILDDAGNGFRHKQFQKFWPKALTKGNPHVIAKISRPLLKGDLWETLRARPERLTLIVTADDLREQGVKISRRISWERTAEDFVWQMTSNPLLLFLNSCDSLIVRFGVDGAILYRRYGGKVVSRLYFDPNFSEGGFKEVYPGKMIGAGNAFVAGLVSQIVNDLSAGVTDDAVVQGICSARRLWQHGFGSDLNGLDYPYKEIIAPVNECDFKIAAIDIPAAPQQPQKVWTILQDVAKSVESIAYNYAIKGSDPTLDKVPVGKFGNLVTLDRSEIESFSSIKNLIREYLESKSNKPLSIAVFGPPGSGKSFGVTEVAKSVAPGRLPDKPLEFNLSQFKATEELITAFHKTRDVALGGKVPMVFFDEFDSELNGTKLGWLKYFLMPMQDGKFRHGEVEHPIGKSIFVFAGGTKDTYELFSNPKNDKGNPDLSFKDAKGPDFVSRLRGYVNIKGPNPIDEEDNLYMIRRAMMLRVLLKKSAPHIFSGKKCLIDPGVLRAFVKVPKLRHGVRSLQSVIEMSTLADVKSYEQASLPSPEQLELHVDAQQYSQLVMRDVILGAAREKLAKAIHEDYRTKSKKERIAPWDKLRDDMKTSNLEQADDIPSKLSAIGFDFRPVTGSKPTVIKFTADEVETLAELEHERFVKERLRQNWTLGPKRNRTKKISPYLVEWDHPNMTEEVKAKDRESVREIPRLMALAGFEIYRLE